MRRSSTSRCPTRTWPSWTRSTAPAAPTARWSAGGGHERRLLVLRQLLELLLGSSPLSVQPARLGFGGLELLPQLIGSPLRGGGLRLELAQLSPQVADTAALLAGRAALLGLGAGRRGRDAQPGERLEARRLQLLGEPAALQQRPAVLGERAGAERGEHAVERRLAASGAGEDLPPARRERLERALLVATRVEERVSLLGADCLGLRAGELLARLDEALHVELSLPREL